MTPQMMMKRRINQTFLMMCLTLGIQFALGIPVAMVLALEEFGISLPSYYTEFVLLQFLYPIATCSMALITLRILRIPAGALITANPIKKDFWPWLGLFLGVSVVMNYLINFLLWLLEIAGLALPDLFLSYNPKDVPQAICYFVVLAILPPVCEEVLCRATLGGLLKHFNPWLAVFVSAYAFGMMHGNVQQIPFAFVLGVVLGFVYVKTGNLLYPILFHFVNNCWACIMTYVSIWGSEFWQDVIGYGVDLLFLAVGVVSLLWLWKKKQFTLSEIPHSLTVAEGRAAVVKSPWFWVFTGIYAALTFGTLGLDILQGMDLLPF